VKQLEHLLQLKTSEGFCFVLSALGMTATLQETIGTDIYNDEHVY